MVEENHTTNATNAPDVQHEKSDVNYRAILQFGGGMVLMGAIIQVVLIWLYGYFQASDQAAKRPNSAWKETARMQLPPEPRLEAIEPLVEKRSEESSPEQVLRTYGWVDRQSGTVRIPIDEAMKLLTEGSREPASGVKEPDLPSRSNSGRPARKEGR